jgi:glycosyltransferase involved in cell wall biosynthesis
VDVGDVRERLEGISGCYIVEDNPESIAAALERVHAGPPAVGGRERMRELSLEAVSVRLIGIYRRVLAGAAERAAAPASNRTPLPIRDPRGTERPSSL